MQSHPELDSENNIAKLSKYRLIELVELKKASKSLSSQSALSGKETGLNVSIYSSKSVRQSYNKRHLYEVYAQHNLGDCTQDSHLRSSYLMHPKNQLR